LVSNDNGKIPCPKKDDSFIKALTAVDLLCFGFKVFIGSFILGLILLAQF